MGTISKSHIINQASEAELQKLLPLTHFIIREQKPDYHIDFLIELNQENEPSGICFYVQLKGIENVRITKNSIKCSLKTKHLIYYLDKVKQYPVFLFVNDNTTTKTYWLFVQKQLKESITNTQWRKQHKLTLSITKEKLITDLDRFQNIVKDANVYMNELWPSSVASSIIKEKELFDKLDSTKWDYQIEVNGKNIRYKFHTDEKLDIKFKVKDGNKLKDYLKDPEIEYFSFKSSEVEVTGSDLMNELLKKSDDIQFSVKNKEIDVDLFIYQKGKDSINDSINLQGKLTYNNFFGKIKCENANSPFGLNISMLPQDVSKLKINISFDFSSWINRPISFLPYLEKYYDFFSKVNENSILCIKIESMGETFYDGLVKMQNSQDFLEFVNKYFLLAKKLKMINEHFKLEMIFPGFENVKNDEVRDVKLLYDLIVSKEHISEEKKLTIDVEIKNNPNLYDRFEKGADIRLISDYTFTICGKVFTVEKIAVDISSPKCLITQKKLKELISSDLEYIPLKFITDDNSKILYRLLQDGNEKTEIQNS